MGQSPTDYHKRHTMYLSLLSLCLVSISTASPAPEATPEADPYLIHGYGGLGYPYTYGYNPYFVPTLVKSAEKEDSTETMEADTKTVEDKKIVSPFVYNTYGGYPYGYTGYPSLTQYYRGKREAEAAPEAEADPYLIYGGFPCTYPYLHHPVIKPVKVEADVKTAEDKKEVLPLVYNYGHPYGLGFGYHGVPVVKTVTGKTLVSPTYGIPTHYITKREAEARPEAEAEADPYLVHGYRSFYPYTYSHGQFGGYQRGYYPYSHGYYGHYLG